MCKVIVGEADESKRERGVTWTTYLKGVALIISFQDKTLMMLQCKILALPPNHRRLGGQRNASYFNLTGHSSFLKERARRIKYFYKYCSAHCICWGKPRMVCLLNRVSSSCFESVYSGCRLHGRHHYYDSVYDLKDTSFNRWLLVAYFYQRSYKKLQGNTSSLNVQVPCSYAVVN